MRALSHSDLIQQCLDHREHAWEEFLRRFSSLIYSTILKVSLPADEQEEAFQATVVAVYSQLPKLRDPDRLVSWVIGIAWRQAVNRIRQRSRETRMEEVSDPVLRHALDRPSEDPLADDERIRLERAQWAADAIEHLPERCRRLLTYMFFEDPPPDYVEIARRENSPIGSLGPTRARCLERMRKYFQSQGWRP